MQSINELIPFAPLLFGGILTAGLVYIGIMFFLGGLGDFDMDIDVDVDIDADIGVDADASSEAIGISLNVIAAFCVGVGAMGLVAALNEWSWLLTVLSSLLFGAILGRILHSMLIYAIRAQGGDVIKEQDLVGSTVRVTVPIPAGKLGEGMITEPERMKYAIKNVDDEPLDKGDMVRVVDVQQGRLLVQK